MSEKLRSLCCPRGSSLFLAMPYSSCSWETTALQSAQVTLAEWGVCGHRGHSHLRREVKAHIQEMLGWSFPAVPKVHFCEHRSCCASCTCAASRRLDAMKQINLGIPVLGNQYQVLGRMQAQPSITWISHVGVVQSLPKLYSIRARCDYWI